jgi:outer membrane protein assembly factor BamB
MFECCKFRGSLVALDAATGKQIWKTYTIAEPANMTGRTSVGTPTWGPSGVSIWSAPTIDLQKKAIYAGTGINFTQPATSNSDAVMAFDMDSGRILWSQQLTPGDAFNFGCQGGNGPNCPKDAGKDTDFGNSGILRSLGNGKRVLVIGQKSGMLHGLDPDQQGKILWQTRIAAGGPQGGVIWGSASDDKGVAYIGISDWNPGKSDAGGGLAAVQMGTGEKLWITPAPKPACMTVPGCSAAQPAPPAVIPGAVFLGSMDGHMRAYDAKDGKIIWDFDTLRDFQTVNGVKARGRARRRNLGKHQDMLAGQGLDDGAQVEALGLDLGFRLRDAHLVLRPDGDAGVLLAVFEQHQPAVGLERRANPLQHFLGLREFVVDVHQDDQVHPPGGQFRIGLASQHRSHVSEPCFGRVLAQLIQHLRLKIVGIYLAARAHALGHAQSDVAGTGAHLGHGHPRLDADGIERAFDILFGFALGTIQPVRAPRAHHTGNAPPRERMDGLESRRRGRGQDQQQQNQRNPAPLDLPSPRNLVKLVHQHETRSAALIIARGVVRCRGAAVDGVQQAELRAT